jgi:alkanesulfonate monooxygenase SsuD/methylene tetrahydromethanopterin reductase-like flavin-dependent oxidoreductase (luciferase family)
VDLGVALPTMVDGLTGKQTLAWARGAEEYGFATLAVLDRLVCPAPEPLIALATAAAVTERIRLATSVLVAAYRNNPALLAKQAATLHQQSGGRLVLGVAAGIRSDDFEVSGADYRRRGRHLDALLDELARTWAEGRIGPRLDGDVPPVLVGGRGDAALVRMARYGQGTVVVGAPGEVAERGAQARSYWTEAGRAGRPRLVAQAYFALGPDGPEDADRHLRSYYAFAGPVAEYIARAALTTPRAVADAVAGYERAGCDEVILVPCSTDTRQLDLLAAAVKEIDRA